MNKTYIAFGAVGQTNLARQSAQDANSFALAGQGSPVQRALAKSSALYCNSSWDLVDACKGTNFNLSTLKTEELPVEMQKMTEIERKTYVETRTKEREKLQAEISRLNADRNKYVAEKSKQHSTTNTLDSVVVTTVREQAMKRNFRFE